MGLKGVVALVLGLAWCAQGATPPAQRDPLGLAGSWAEFWPGVPLHDANTIQYENGQYAVDSVTAEGARQRITNVRLDGNVLRFTEQSGKSSFEYEVRVQDANTLAVRAQGGGMAGGDQVVWRRQTAATAGPQTRPVPAGQAPDAGSAILPWAAPGDLVISLRWETAGADVDLQVIGPNGRTFPPLRDVTKGPGEEVCVVRNPAPGDYRVQATWCTAPTEQPIPVTARVQFGGRTEGPFQATLLQRGAAGVHTFRVPGVPIPEPVAARPGPQTRPAAPAAPGDLVVTMRWETRGTDVDLYVTDPRGRRRPVVQDVTQGPGEEVCIIHSPTPGDYRIEAVYCDSAGNQATPVVADVQFAGRREGPFRGTVAREGDRVLVDTFRVPGAAGATAGPDVTIRMRWETRGTDIDLYVFDPDGERCPVVEDVTSGPGEEVCIVRDAAPGEYRIEAQYCGPQNGPPTPVTVRIDVGGKAEGPYQATVERPGEQAHVHTLALLPKGGGGPGCNLVVTLAWETRGTDVDLVVTDPNGQRCNVLNDVTSGPGEEVCIVRNPAPGEYRIEALYADAQGGQRTPVTVRVQLGGRAVGTYQAALQRQNERVLVQTVQVPPGPQGAAPEGRARLQPSRSSAPEAAQQELRPPAERAGDPFRRTPQQPDAAATVPGPSLLVTLAWETRGTDVDLVVTNPRGQPCPPFRDVTQGPGRETVVVRQPLPGEYRIEALYFNDRGGQTTPVTVEVRRDGRLEGVYRATLERRGQQVLVHTVRF